MRLPYCPTIGRMASVDPLLRRPEGQERQDRVTPIAITDELALMRQPVR